ncbi:MAG TPA: protein yceI precursor [Solibacterales bacterium]|nr:protein yceI precursor [Bryobacterales bacterium]
MKLFVAAAACSLVAPAFAQVNSWTIDSSHSGAHFAVRHMMVSNVRGQFGKMSGTVEFDPKNLTLSKVNATIEVASVNTQDAKRDEHLRSADFFDVAKFPAMTFVSKAVKPMGAGKLQMTGDLTMKGVTKEVTFDVEGPSPELVARGTARSGASASAKINRKDFGVTWNRALDAGGVAVGDEVSITIDIEMVRKLAAN